MIRTVNLKAGIEAHFNGIGRYISIENLGSSGNVYASASSGVSAGMDGVRVIPAGYSKVIPSIDKSVYLLSDVDCSVELVGFSNENSVFNLATINHNNSGTSGANGKDGTDGKSAYQLAVDSGFKGTLDEWLTSLKGINGVNGTNGTNGVDGKSAYENALEGGYIGTEDEFSTDLAIACTKSEEGIWTPRLKLRYNLYKDGKFVSSNYIYLETREDYAYNKANYMLDGNMVCISMELLFNKPQIELEDGQTAKLTSASISGLPFPCKDGYDIYTSCRVKKMLDSYLLSATVHVSSDLPYICFVEPNKVFGSTVESITDDLIIALGFYYPID